MMQATLRTKDDCIPETTRPMPGKEDEMTALTMNQTASVPVLDALKSIGRHIRTLRARRAERMEIASLLDLDPGRLDDLGVNAGDIRDALRAPVPPGPSLALSRAISARRWFRDAKIAG
jgi:uncharacterized protein YjiS (DUF1127 family)